MAFSYQRCARILGLVAVSVLGVALGLWALVALVEALAVFVLILVVASLALPHSMGWYWRRARRELARLVLAFGLWLDSACRKDASAGTSAEDSGDATGDATGESQSSAEARNNPETGLKQERKNP